jgi:hypothetical protein
MASMGRSRRAELETAELTLPALRTEHHDLGWVVVVTRVFTDLRLPPLSVERCRAAAFPTSHLWRRRVSQRRGRLLRSRRPGLPRPRPVADLAHDQAERLLCASLSAPRSQRRIPSRQALLPLGRAARTQRRALTLPDHALTATAELHAFVLSRRCVECNRRWDEPTPRRGVYFTATSS